MNGATVRINLEQRKNELRRAQARADATLAEVRRDEQEVTAADSSLRTSLAKVKGELAQLFAAEQSRRAIRSEATARKQVPKQTFYRLYRRTKDIHASLP